MDELEKVIEQLICNYAKIPVLSLDNETALNELGYDSFSRTELLVAIEETIEKEIPLEYLHPKYFESVSAVKELVQKCYVQK